MMSVFRLKIQHFDAQNSSWRKKEKIEKIFSLNLFRIHAT